MRIIPPTARHAIAGSGAKSLVELPPASATHHICLASRDFPAFLSGEANSARKKYVGLHADVSSTNYQ